MKVNIIRLFLGLGLLVMSVFILRNPDGQLTKDTVALGANIIICFGILIISMSFSEPHE